jgi:Fic family protein
MESSTQESVTFCAEEAERQGRGPIQVAWMVEAWLYATEHPLTTSTDEKLRVIKMLGHLVERENPKDNWRRYNVRVGDRICPNVAEVPDLMTRWAARLFDMKPSEAYYEFELIHPFVDGNGRVGKIIFNSLADRMKNPFMPPDFFNCANP